MAARRRTAFLALLWISSAPAQTYRFDDNFASKATVNAPPAAGVLRLGEPVTWDFNDQTITWTAARGRIGFKPGQLVVQGQGSTPVLVSPANPAVDWSRYDSLVIRMMADGGGAIKIKLGEQEFKQTLGPPMQWHDYRFSLEFEQASFTRPLAIMPTDDVKATVAIDSIALVPRESPFNRPAGVANVGKREEYRNALFARAPSSIAYDAPVPPHAVLHFGAGVSSPSPVTFRILIGSPAKEVFSVTVRDPQVWQDMVVDLSRHAAASQRIVFRTESASPDAVGFWANPLLLGKAPQTRPNVLLYVVCTLRPDHTSLYGYARDTTPFLKKLGASSVVFEDATGQAPWTKPSVASLMTSLHAYSHGLVNDTDTIPAGASTLAGQLRKAGYSTASIVANPFAGRTSGLQRGFDTIMEYPVVQRHRTDSVDRGTDSAAINRAILPWLDEHAAEPFFLYVQSTDPHAPYRPPPEFEAKFANPAETTLVDSLYAKLRDIRAYGGGATVTRDEMRSKGVDPEPYIKQVVDRYDAEIAHNDRQIELLLDRLKKLGVFDNSVVVIASDHGEEFWEHNQLFHGQSVYGELNQVPMVYRWPNSPDVNKGVMIDQQVQNLDIMPTILELAGIQGPTNMQGRSLVSLLNGTGVATWQEQPAITQTMVDTDPPPGSASSNKVAKPHIGIIDHGWKLVRKEVDPEAQQELYEHPIDNLNLTNVIKSEGPASRVKALAGTLETWKSRARAAQLASDETMTQQMSSEELRRLRALGYVGGGAPAKPATNNAVSPTTNAPSKMTTNVNATGAGTGGDKKDGSR